MHDSGLIGHPVAGQASHDPSLFQKKLALQSQTLATAVVPIALVTVEQATQAPCFQKNPVLQSQTSGLVVVPTELAIVEQSAHLLLSLSKN